MKRPKIELHGSYTYEEELAEYGTVYEELQEYCNHLESLLIRVYIEPTGLYHDIKEFIND